jgi:hypothetical protein
MSLTEQALYERRWGEFPGLAQLLDKKQLHWSWYGNSSVSDNIFSSMSRHFEICALVHDNEHEIKQAIENNGDQIRIDLHNLSRSLKDLSRQFEEASHDIEKLSYHCR